MQTIRDISELEAIYGQPGEASLVKVVDHITPLYHRWIERSQFCILSTVGPEGTDASPRGDDGAVVSIPDSNTLLLPDWRGNNRMDSLRNILSDERVSLMFFVLGANNVIRVNGRASITVDADCIASFDRDGKRPRSVVIISVEEVYSQCARALMRAGIWSGRDQSGDLPTIGDLLAEAKSGFDGRAYDSQWASRAKGTMW